MEQDTIFLKRAIELAERSAEPVKCGVVLVDTDGRVVAETFNTQRADGLTASHAEMKAIALANAKHGRKLDGITAYGNCEPCTMCLTALIFAKVDRVVFAKRLNDFVTPDQRIDIDCFEFVEKFPRAPKLEYVAVG